MKDLWHALEEQTRAWDAIGRQGHEEASKYLARTRLRTSKVVEARGFEPLTSCVQSRRSPS